MENIRIILNMSFKTVAWFIVMCALLACEQQVPQNELQGDQARVKNTIILYNQLLSNGYRTLNMTALTEAATEERAMEAYYHMSALGEAGVKMEALLNHIDFSAVHFTGDGGASVTTQERWEYKYAGIDKGEDLYENGVFYRNTYNLIRQNDRWLVADIIIEESKEEKDIPFPLLQLERDGSAVHEKEEGVQGTQ